MKTDKNLEYKTKKTRRLQMIESNKRIENTIVWDKLAGRDTYKDQSVVQYCYARKAITDNLQLLRLKNLYC